jgi:hypothetical protein
MATKIVIPEISLYTEQFFSVGYYIPSGLLKANFSVPHLSGQTPETAINLVQDNLERSQEANPVSPGWAAEN